MFARIALMFMVTTGLCAGAFTLGGRASAAQGEAAGIPDEHPIALALRFKQELNLTPDQLSQLEQLRGELAKEFAPFKEQAESIQRQMQELQQSGKQDEDAANRLKKQADDLGMKMQPLFERYGQSVAKLLTPDQIEKLGKLAAGAHAHGSEGQEFVLMFVMQSREQLGITPQQFTQLQYLQADFIRAFAPLREAMEMLQMEVQEKFGKNGTEPDPEYRERGGAIQKKIQELQTKFSERAVTEVLHPDQRAKLGELMNGQHRSAPNGG